MIHQNPKHRGGRQRSAQPRQRKNGTAIPPVVAGQLTQDEANRLRVLWKNIGRSQSYVVRAAIIRLLAQDAAGQVDWSKVLESIADPLPYPIAQTA